MAFQSTSINQHLFELSSVKVFFFFICFFALDIFVLCCCLSFRFLVLSITTKSAAYIYIYRRVIHELNILPCFYIAYMATRETHTRMLFIFFILNACRKLQCTYICFLNFRIFVILQRTKGTYIRYSLELVFAFSYLLLINCIEKTASPPKGFLLQ